MVGPLKTRSPTTTSNTSSTSTSSSTGATSSTSSTSGTAPSTSAAPADLFETSAPSRLETPPRNGGLPDELLRSERARVVHGTDPGDFYCEHMFFTTQREAMKPQSSVGVNEQGERLVGFLHLPPDEHTYRPQPSSGAEPYTQAERHGGTRDVIGAALRGYFPDAARAAGDGPVRIQLGGYETFQSVQNNPTGDFVRHRENLDGAMQRAFGRNLVTPEGERLPREDGQPEGAERYRYLVQDPSSGREREVILQAQSFPVTDDAIDGPGARSVQRSMEGFRPHAVISMGVASGDSYRAEFHADDGGLVTDSARQSHDEQRAPTTSLPDNYSLGRAIHRGTKPESVPLSSLLSTAGPRRA